jgi:GNAT superfamily N-acetyltransferase
MSGGPLVREARPDERDDVLRVVEASYAEFEPHLEPEEWSTMSKNLAGIVAPNAAGRLLVAELDGQLVGTATYLPPGPREYKRVPQEWAVIRGVGVHPAWRGRGVARRLSERCLDMARADNAPTVGLHTAAMFHPARRLYESLGFTQQHDFQHLGVQFWIYALPLDDAGQR